MGVTVEKLKQQEEQNIVGSVIQCCHGICVVIETTTCGIKVMKLDCKQYNNTKHKLGRRNKITLLDRITIKKKYPERWKWLAERYLIG